VRSERALYRDVRRRGLVPPLPLSLDGPATFAQRTAFIDQEVARAVGRGIDQVVLVGAGYDGRALRFAGHTRWFEVDDPGTVDDKQRRLALLGLPPSPQAVFPVRVDLVTGGSGAIGGLGDALHAAGHRDEAPSLFVCEGLFPHLALDTVSSLCEALRARASDGSVLASTFLVMPHGRAGAMSAAAATALRSAADLLLKVGGEPRRSDLQPGDPQKLMMVTGWHVTRTQPTGPGRLYRGAYLLALSATPAP
jgi:methyltransferase (TIGR00027 family)